MLDHNVLQIASYAKVMVHTQLELEKLKKEKKKERNASPNMKQSN